MHGMIPRSEMKFTEVAGNVIDRCSLELEVTVGENSFQISYLKCILFIIRKSFAFPSRYFLKPWWRLRRLKVLPDFVPISSKYRFKSLNEYNDITIQYVKLFKIKHWTVVLWKPTYQTEISKIPDLDAFVGFMKNVVLQSYFHFWHLSCFL